MARTAGQGTRDQLTSPRSVGRSVGRWCPHHLLSGARGAVTKNRRSSPPGAVKIQRRVDISTDRPFYQHHILLLREGFSIGCNMPLFMFCQPVQIGQPEGRDLIGQAARRGGLARKRHVNTSGLDRIDGCGSCQLLYLSRQTEGEELFISSGLE